MTRKMRKRVERIVSISMVTITVVGLAVINSGMIEPARWEGYLEGLSAVSFMVLYIVATFTVGSMVGGKRRGRL